MGVQQNPGNGDTVLVGGKLRVVRNISSANVATGTTDSSLVAVSGTLKVRVLSLHVQIGATATAVTIGSKVGVSATTAVSPAWEFGANGGMSLPGNGTGSGVIEDTAAGAALVVTTGAAGATTHIGGTFCYID